MLFNASRGEKESPSDTSQTKKLSTEVFNLVSDFHSDFFQPIKLRTSFSHELLALIFVSFASRGHHSNQDSEQRLFVYHTVSY